MAIPIPVPTGKILEVTNGKITNWLTRRAERIEIQNLRLALPLVIHNENRETDVMQFDLIFKVASKTTQPVDDFAWGLVLEHDSETQEDNVATHNLRGTAAAHDGLTEPQFAPLLIRTDFENFIRFLNDPISGSITTQGITEIENEVDIRVKVRASNITGHVIETTLQDLLTEWIADHEGMAVNGFQQRGITEDSKFSDRIIGEDIMMP